MIGQRLIMASTLLFAVTSVVVAMDGQSIPTIDFKNKTKEELNRLAIEMDVLALTPRSKQSLEDRVKELGITQKSGDLIYTALASDGSRKANTQDIDVFIMAKMNQLNAQKRALVQSKNNN
jgi:hypothetical protein